MRDINKLIPLLTLSLSSIVTAQLPSFLQRFKPKQSLLASASSVYPSLFSPLTSSSSIYPSYTTSLLGSSSSNSFPFLGSTSSLGSGSIYGSASNFGSIYGSPSFASLGLGSSPLKSYSGPPSYSPSSFGTSSFLSSSSGNPFSSSGLGTFSFLPPSGSTSFSSSGLGSPNNFQLSNNFGSGSFGLPSFGGTISNLGSASSLRPLKFDPTAINEFGGNSGFDGLIGAFDPSDLVGEYPGFSTASFGKDLNFDASSSVKFPQEKGSSFFVPSKNQELRFPTSGIE